MQFGKALVCVLQAIINANPGHGPVKLIKVGYNMHQGWSWG
jgi:hypothetical protein